MTRSCDQLPAYVPSQRQSTPLSPRQSTPLSPRASMSMMMTSPRGGDNDVVTILRDLYLALHETGKPNLTITMLVLENVALAGREESLCALAQMCALAPAITRFYLNSVSLRGDGLRVLALRYFVNVPQLAELTLSNNEIDSRGVKVLAKVLVECARLNRKSGGLQLRRLDLNGNVIGNGGMKALAAALAALPHLAALDVSDNDETFSQDGAVALAEALGRREVPLALRYAGVGACATLPFLCALPATRMLTSLDLSRNNLNDGMTCWLMRALMGVGTELSELSLAQNADFTDESATMMTTALGFLPRLASIDLDGTGLTADGINVLKKKLFSLKRSNVVLRYDLDYGCTGGAISEICGGGDSAAATGSARLPRVNAPIIGARRLHRCMSF